MRKAIELYPDYSISYFNLGNIYLKIGKHNEAIVSYKEALLHNSNFPEAFENLSMVLIEIKSFDKASELI